MKKWLYVFKSGSLAALMGAWTALGGAVGIALLPLMQSWVPPLYGVAMGVCAALYVAYHGKDVRVSELEAEIRQIHDNTPNVVIHEVRTGRVVFGNYHLRPPKYPVWQLWFRNEPVLQTPAAIARKLRATVSFCDSDWNPILTISGQWATTELPDDVAWLETHDSIDLSTVGENAKLLVAAQWDAEISDAEGREKLPGALTGELLRSLRTLQYQQDDELQKDVTRLKIRLIAENMNPREFQFRLERDQVDGSLKDITRTQ